MHALQQLVPARLGRRCRAALVSRCSIHGEAVWVQELLAQIVHQQRLAVPPKHAQAAVVVFVIEGGLGEQVEESVVEGQVDGARVEVLQGSGRGATSEMATGGRPGRRRREWGRGGAAALPEAEESRPAGRTYLGVGRQAISPGRAVDEHTQQLAGRLAAVGPAKLQHLMYSGRGGGGSGRSGTRLLEPQAAL